MSASYSGDPQSTPKDGIRFLIGDTTAPFKFSDEEIVFTIETEANMWMAAALLCDRVLVETGSTTSKTVASKTVGGLSISYASTDIEAIRKKATLYRLRGSGHMTPSFAEIDQIFDMKQFDNRAALGRSEELD